MSTNLQRLFVTNPLFEEATRARRKFFRTAGGPGKGIAFTIVFITALVYLWLLTQIVNAKGGMPEMIFILYLQLTLVTLFVPLWIYGAISGEREKTTWDALILTRLTPGQIVAGKLLWRVAGLTFLMGLFVPALILCVSTNSGQRTYEFSGGISPATLDFAATQSAIGQVVNAEFMTFCWGFVLCAYGLWVSANTRKSITSAALIYISLLALLVLLPVLLNMIGGPATDADYSGNYVGWILMHINVFYALGNMNIANSYNDRSDSGPDPMLGNEWGVLQSVLYIALAALFLFSTYRTLRLWEELKSRIG